MTPEENAQRIADLETRLLGRGNAHLALVQTSIAAQASLVGSIKAALDQQLALINSRLDKIDGGSTRQSANQATMIAVDGVAAAVISILVVIATNFMTSHSNAQAIAAQQGSLK